ncbi:MAG: penicillin acylase family protein [Pyrinomonadaceae bacterium]
MKKNLILLAAIFAVSVAGCFAQTPDQITKNELRVSGLKKSVTVLRDDRSIPYIEAENDADLYFAQGFVTASDRLWQMDLYRRLSRGETAEIFGRLTLEEDKRWRRFGFAGIVEESYKGLSPEYKSILENYARGVNAYIATLDEKTLPAEFQILQYRPQSWKPTDSLMIGAILADGLSSTWFADVMRQSFSVLPKEKYDRLFIEKNPLDVLVVGRDKDEKSGKSAKNVSDPPLRQIGSKNLALLDSALSQEALRKNSLERIGFYREFGAASNNWVVSGKRTLNGKPILANDPHLPASAPSIWYLSNLSSGQMRVSGVTFPGVPGIVLGHNQYIAWGATNLGPDVQDLYAETFNEKNQYKNPEGWADARVRTESIKVRKNPLNPETETVSFDVLETRNGVIVTEADGKKYALKWTARDPKNDFFGVFQLLNRAKNWEEFNAALKTYGGPTQNFVYADVRGNIGFHNGGVIPIRRSGDGSVPYDGSTNAGDWVGFIPYEELPQSYNPPEGFIVTANQRIVGDNYKHFLTHLWADPYRARRIYQLLESNSKLTVDDVSDIQHDIFNISYSGFAREIVKLQGAGKDTLELLSGWDGRMAADSKAALLVLRLRRNFLKKILEANIGKDLASRYRWGMDDSFIDWLSREKPHEWLPKEYAGYKELLLAVDRETREGKTNDDLQTYGEVFKIRFSHPLAQAPLVGSVFVVQPVPQRGSGLTPNVGANVSMRHITVPGDWDETRHEIGLGQSGNPKSPFFKDQTENWLSGSTPVFPFSSEAVKKAARQVLVMEP